MTSADSHGALANRKAQRLGFIVKETGGKLRR